MVQAGACRRPGEEVASIEPGAGGCTLSALGRSGATAGVGCGDWMTVMGRQRNRKRSRDRLVTGGDGSLDYPLTRARTADKLFLASPRVTNGDAELTAATLAE